MQPTNTTGRDGAKKTWLSMHCVGLVTAARNGCAKWRLVQVHTADAAATTATGSALQQNGTGNMHSVSELLVHGPGYMHEPEIELLG
jgi:hypothetical protein